MASPSRARSRCSLASGEGEATPQSLVLGHRAHGDLESPQKLIAPPAPDTTGFAPALQDLGQGDWSLAGLEGSPAAENGTKISRGPSGTAVWTQF